jgi:glycosyltransferase involved in cell wall biosynthesis
VRRAEPRSIGYHRQQPRDIPRLMRVLITNTRLEGRGGTETFVRQLARGLQAAGHSAMAYGSDPTELPRLLESDLIPVATDLEGLPFRPDIIHAQHHLDAMTAITALPGVPAIYHCHGAIWRESVPKHPRIHHYLAVSTTLRERMSVEFLVPPSDISVVPNGVDMRRFRPRDGAPPARLARALFYNSRHEPDSPTVRAVRTATQRRGIEIDFVGTRFGQLADAPETLLPQYDVAFASGLSAIEAMACGCAVVILGRTSCGELVRPGNFDRYRGVNFTIAVNSPEPCAEAIGAELDRYIPDETAATSARARLDGDFDRMVEALIPVYERAIARHRSTPEDLTAEVLATSRYLRGIVPLIKMTDRMLNSQWSSPTRATTLEEVRAEVELLRQRMDQRT